MRGQLQAVWFAAGTATLMACFERAVLVSFVEQWRVVVFLALNLLLLAILFTSPLPPTNSTNESEPTIFTQEECQGSVELAMEDEVTMKRRKQCTRNGGDSNSRVCRRELSQNDKVHELSKEEFNERVEAFIATFRQHLVSDAKGKSKSCRLHSSSSSPPGWRQSCVQY